MLILLSAARFTVISCLFSTSVGFVFFFNGSLQQSLSALVMTKRKLIGRLSIYLCFPLLLPLSIPNTDRRPKPIQTALVLPQSALSGRQPACNDSKLWYMSILCIHESTPSPTIIIILVVMCFFCVCRTQGKGRSPAPALGGHRWHPAQV